MHKVLAYISYGTGVISLLVIFIDGDIMKGIVLAIPLFIAGNYFRAKSKERRIKLNDRVHNLNNPEQIGLDQYVIEVENNMIKTDLNDWLDISNYTKDFSLITFSGRLRMINPECKSPQFPSYNHIEINNTRYAIKGAIDIKNAVSSPDGTYIEYDIEGLAELSKGKGFMPNPMVYSNYIILHYKKLRKVNI